MIDHVDENVKVLDYQEMLNVALEETGDPQGYAKTLLSALVKADVATEALRPLRPLVAPYSPRLRLIR